jgi:hypothetical protein
MHSFLHGFTHSLTDSLIHSIPECSEDPWIRPLPLSQQARRWILQPAKPVQVQLEPSPLIIASELIPEFKDLEPSLQPQASRLEQALKHYGIVQG